VGRCRGKFQPLLLHAVSTTRVEPNAPAHRVQLLPYVLLQAD